MRRFARLFDELDTTTATNLKVDALRRYLASAPPADAAWATYILSGRKLRRLVGPALLRRWLVEASGLPTWLVEETYQSVGDLAETIALLVAAPDGRDVAPPEDLPLATWIEERLLPLRGLPEAEQRERVTQWWSTLPYLQCFLLNKLLTGALRVGVSESLVLRALAELTGHPRPHLARALMGDWPPGAAFWERLVASEPPAHDPATPYPFHLAAPLEQSPDSLGVPAQYVVEWKWDGIRAQLVRREGRSWLWSRGAELVTDSFPEILDASRALPDGTVLDGELLPWTEGGVGRFAELQQRLGRKRLTPALLAAVPVRFMAYDLLEARSEDLRSRPLQERRRELAGLLQQLGDERFILSTTLDADDWAGLRALREQSRRQGVEGLMLKARDSTYGTGRERGAWWKWKVDPYTFDGVLLYAQPGHGRRSNLYTDYTFAVWHEGTLLPVAKAYSGLTDREIVELDRWIRGHTLEKFGPVRSVEPRRVFELAFEGIARSPRHKSGLALRFPRILRERSDKPAPQADTLATLQSLLDAPRG